MVGAGCSNLQQKIYQRSRFDSRVKEVRCISSLNDTASEELQVIYAVATENRLAFRRWA